MDFIKKIAPGFLLCLIIAIPAWFLGKLVPVVGGPVFSILIGMIVTLLIKEKGKLAQGIQFTSKKILQFAVIMLGFGLNLQMIAEVGMTSLPIIISTIATALIVSFILWKLMKINSTVSILVGVGSSICGGSAIAATAPVVDADDKDIAQAISVIFLFNVIAALIFPGLGDLLGLSNEGFGLFAGTAVNDTSSVTAAASAWDAAHNTGTYVLDTATIVKLTRTLAIIPITLVLSIYRAKKEQKAQVAATANGQHEHTKSHGFSLKKSFPMFILWFVVASIITTLYQLFAEHTTLPDSVVWAVQGFFKACKTISKFSIVMAMGAIGLNTHIVKLIKSGAKPILQGLICWICIAAVSLGMQHALHLW